MSEKDKALSESVIRKAAETDDGAAEAVQAFASGLASGIEIGNSQAAQNFADWLDLPAKHKKEQLEREKLETEIDKPQAEIDLLKMGSGGGSQDNEFLNAWKQSIIDGYKDDKDDEE